MKPHCRELGAAAYSYSEVSTWVNDLYIAKTFYGWLIEGAIIDTIRVKLQERSPLYEITKVTWWVDNDYCIDAIIEYGGKAFTSLQIKPESYWYVRGLHERDKIKSDRYPLPRLVYCNYEYPKTEVVHIPDVLATVDFQNTLNRIFKQQTATI